MFRVKICGITSRQDALFAVDAGADALGLNFYSKSPRCCTLAAAQEITAAVPANVCRVGVFVGTAAGEIRRVAREVPLDLIQLHGNETPEVLAELRPLPLMKAVGTGDNLLPVVAFLEECHRLRAMPRMLLVDAMRGETFGGTGQTIDWPFVAKNRPQFGGLPLVLAGGLRPENVGPAIQAVRPWAVDVASGVESSPGKKSVDLVRAFVAAAKAAFAGLVARG